MTIASEIQLLAPSALIELFELDTGKYGGPVLRWHAGTNEVAGDIVFAGYTYSRFPVEVSGFDLRGTGTTPRPTIKASNIGGTIAATARGYGDFMGCKLTRIRTFSRYLDAVNFASGLNATADATASFPKDIYFVDRKANENNVFIEWELAAAFDMLGVTLPRRQVIQNACAWQYRSTECGYTGAAVADVNDVATSVLASDVCGKRLGSCRLRFPAPASVPFGGFPGAGLLRG